MLNKKGASEIIVTMLIVVVVVILATVLFAWFKSSSQNKLDETTDELKQVSDFKCMDASFIIESCVIDSDKNFSILFSNSSDIRLFNLVLSIHGKNNEEDSLVVGRFNDIIQPGEIKNLKTSGNFVFLTGDNSTLSAIDTIDNIILTNAACPNKILNLNCE